MVYDKLSINSKGVLAKEYVDWLNQYSNIKASIEISDNGYVPEFFLTVITRTQGKRPETLRETLLSLIGQSFQDFEVLIVAHNVDEKQKKQLLDIIDDLPVDFSNRVRYVEVEGGTRTKPLNVGFEQARGLYIANLDDDDIALDNWVEGFYEAYKEKPGAVLHAYTLSQKWMMSESKDGSPVIRAVSAPSARKFCKDFNMLKEVYMNLCPLMSVAFPAFAFKSLNIRFDETLNTTEDWDFLMRTVFVVGVTDYRNPTSIYRLWTNAENSQTLHNKAEWDKNYEKITKRFKDNLVLLPKGYSDIITKTQKKKTEDNDKETISLFDQRNYINPALYIGLDDTFNETNVMQNSYEKNVDTITVSYYLESSYRSTTLFRWDPMVYGGFTFENLLVTVCYGDGGEQEYSASDVSSNGVYINRKIMFLKSDPQIIFRTKKGKKVLKIDISVDIVPLSDDILDEHILKESALKKNMRKVWRKVRKR